MKYIAHIISVRVISVFLLLFLCSSCASNNKAIQAYRNIGATLSKKFQLTRGELIIVYDLIEIDGSDCIYSKDLGLIINNTNYQKKYLNKFDKKFRSAAHLRFVASKKVLKLSSLLQKLHKKHKILSNNEYNYLKRLSMRDIRKIDSRKELDRIDEIAKYIPIMLPECHTKISSHYGKRNHPIHGGCKFHLGIDMYSKKSCPVFASASGVVTSVGRRNGYGNVVEIRHKGSKNKEIITTRYAHLNEESVNEGQFVNRGEIIGRQGSSGKVTNEHLHFEIWVNGQHVNPYDFISNDCACQNLR